MDKDKPEAGDKIVKPEEVVVDEVTPDKPTNPPAEATVEAVSEEKPQLSEEQVREELAKTVQPTQKPITRKERAVVKSIKHYSKALDEDGHIQEDILLEEYKKNPKGLESFAEKNQFRVEDLMDIIEENEPIEPEKKSALELRLEALEEEKNSKVQKDNVDRYTNKVVALAEGAGVDVTEFYREYGEEFTNTVTKFVTKGLDLEEAAEAAFAMTAGRTAALKKATQVEKELIFDHTTPMPQGNPTEIAKEMKLMSREAVNNLPDNERIAYKIKFRDSKGIPQYTN